MLPRYIRRKLSKSFKRVRVCIRRKLRSGIDAPRDNQLNSLLHIAVQKGDEKKVLTLLRRGANVNITNYENATPLHMAVQYGHPNLIDVLVEHGACIEITKHDGSTPMHMIKPSPEKIECLERLRVYGADINARNVTGNNILHLMIKAGFQNIKLIKKLLQYGSDVNNLDFLMNTCLHNIALNISNTHYETKTVTEALIAEGINLSHKNMFGESPLHMAVSWDSELLVRILVKHGARLDLENDMNLNPFDLAVENKSIRSVQVITKHIILQKYRGQSVEEKVYQKIQSDSGLVLLYQTLENELHSLKLRKISSFSDCSYYDVLCGNEYDVENIVKNEFSWCVIGNLSLVSLKFYWEIVDAWNDAVRKIIKTEESQFEVKEEYLLSL